MYKELIAFEARSVGYSSCEPDHYGKILPLGLNEEWPDLKTNCSSLQRGSDITIDGTTYHTYKYYGCRWRTATSAGSEFTNCCNSQLAAFTCALGGEKFGVKPQGSAAAVEHDLAVNSQMIQVRLSSNGPIESRGVLSVFGQTFVSAKVFYTADSEPLLVTGAAAQFGGMIYAAKFLNVGKDVFGFSKEQTNIRQMRVGDLATYSGHAFLVGDVRYGVWLGANSGAVPNYILDQSSFIDAPTGGLVAMTGTNVRTVVGRTPMTVNDCDWIIANEAIFEQRIATFLNATALPGPSGSQQQVAKIEVVAWRCFSANGTIHTAHNTEYNKNGNTYVADAAATAERAAINGVTRPWHLPTSKVAIGRFYGRAS